ncbi:conserved hypothetical protein [Histoplasma capsulatum H143]|uniref:N-acetyltransferase domain-containing protein n=1 Tax=Ajellomyces capsulatus (strain H143) TaxID=544712 RepID=C6HBI5_AJECH|nr:conserved hypothetical protein [Histoplasma capsulatum H143]
MSPTQGTGEHKTLDVFTTRRLRMERLDESHLQGPRGVSKSLDDSREFMSGVLRQNNPRAEMFAVYLLPPILAAHRIARQRGLTACSYDGRLCQAGNGGIDAGGNPPMAMIGVVGTHRTDPVAELGYIFHPSAWGKGYATEAVSAFVDRFWPAQVAANEIEAQVDQANAASAHVLGKCGFDLVAERDEDGERLLIFRIFRPAGGGGRGYMTT